jgi:hypothetical protein
LVSIAQGILINNQFPGPQIDAVTNDNLVINVHNNLTEPFLLSWLLVSTTLRHGRRERRGSLVCNLGLVQVRAVCKFLLHRTLPCATMFDFAPPSDRLIGVLDVPKLRFWLTQNVSQLDSVSGFSFSLSFCNLHCSSYDLIPAPPEFVFLPQLEEYALIY